MYIIVDIIYDLLLDLYIYIAIIYNSEFLQANIYTHSAYI